MDCITSFKTNKLILGCLTTRVSFHAPGSIVFFLGGQGGIPHIDQPGFTNDFYKSYSHHNHVGLNLCTNNINE